MLTGWFIYRNRISLISFRIVRHPLQNNISVSDRRQGRTKIGNVRGRGGCGGGGERGAAAHCSLMESGGSRNYFRAAIRRTEIHSVVVKQSLPLSPRGLRGLGKGRRRERGRGHTRERTLSRHAVCGVIDPVLRSPDRCPLHARRQAGPLYPLGNEEIEFRFYSRNLKPPLLRLSLGAMQLSVSYPLPPH